MSSVTSFLLVLYMTLLPYLKMISDPLVYGVRMCRQPAGMRAQGSRMISWAALVSRGVNVDVASTAVVLRSGSNASPVTSFYRSRSVVTVLQISLDNTKNLFSIKLSLHLCYIMSPLLCVLLFTVKHIRRHTVRFTSDKFVGVLPVASVANVRSLSTQLQHPQPRHVHRRRDIVARPRRRITQLDETLCACTITGLQRHSTAHHATESCSRYR